MKKLVGVIFAILLLPVCANAVITDVDIIPSMPTMTDIITISVSGYETYLPDTVDANFSIVNNSLELNVYVQLDWYPTAGTWSYLKEIGTLPAGLYALTVNENARMSGSYGRSNTISMSFEVTPEPATLIFLAIGLPVFRKFTRR